MFIFRLARLFKVLGRDIVLLWYAFRNPSSPLALKVGALFIALYLCSPIDVLPDWIPFLGLADDVTLLALAIPMLLKLMPQPALQEAKVAANGLLSRFKLRSRNSH